MAALLNSDNDSGTFKASALAKWFHSAPHRDFGLDSTTTIFRPDEKSYNEVTWPSCKMNFINNSIKRRCNEMNFRFMYAKVVSFQIAYKQNSRSFNIH